MEDYEMITQFIHHVGGIARAALQPGGWAPGRAGGRRVVRSSLVPGRASLPILSLVATLAVAIPRDASAGKVTITGSEPGTDVTLKYTNPSPPPDMLTQTKKADKDGNARFSLGSIKDEGDIFGVMVTQTFKGDQAASTPYTIRLNTGTGNTIASLEPFDFPAFSNASLASLLVSANVGDYISQGSPLSLGDTLNVSNGMISETSAITFTNADTGNPFTGTVKVTSFDSFSAVPEPSTALMLGLGAMISLCYFSRGRAGYFAADFG